LDTGTLKKSVLIFGCGYIGLELSRVCLEKGWSVSAFTRNQEAAKTAEGMGAQAYTGNLESDQWWGEIPPGFTYVVNAVGAASPSVQGYEQSYLRGMRSMLGWIDHGKQELDALVFTSSSSVYPQTDGSLVTEESSSAGVSERGKILLAAERECLEGVPQLCRSRKVIRFSGLYGPGRHLLVDKIRRGEPMSGCPNRFLNLLHRDDAVSAILSALDAPPGSDVFNACDGQHATRGEISKWVAQRVGVQPPEFIGASEDRGPHRRVANSKIMQRLGWCPRFPDFQSGYEDFLASE